MTEIRVLVYREKFRAEGFQRGRGRGHFLRARVRVFSRGSLSKFYSLSLSLFFFRVSLFCDNKKWENPNSEHEGEELPPRLHFLRKKSRFEAILPDLSLPLCFSAYITHKHRQEYKKT